MVFFFQEKYLHLGHHWIRYCTTACGLSMPIPINSTCSCGQGWRCLQPAESKSSGGGARTTVQSTMAIWEWKHPHLGCCHLWSFCTHSNQHHLFIGNDNNNAATQQWHRAAHWMILLILTARYCSQRYTILDEGCLRTSNLSVSGGVHRDDGFISMTRCTSVDTK